MKIAIDFDGTCVTHEFPEIGKDCPHVINVLKELTDAGHELTLFTMRSGKYLDDAICWFTRRGIKLTGIQYEKDQTAWTSSNKCYAQVYIDDAALGAPLIHDKSICERPFIDWLKVKELLLTVPEDQNAVDTSIS